MFERSLFSRVGLVLALGFFLLQPAAQAADIGFKGLEVRGGVIVPNDWDTGFTLGVAVDLGEIIDGLRIYPSLYYGEAEESLSETIPFAPGLPGGTLTISADLELTYLALGGEVRYFFSGGDRGWYAGGGPYAHWIDYGVLGGSLGVVETDTTSFGLMGVGGYQLGRRLAVEARYDTVSVARSIQVLAAFRFGGSDED